MDKHPPLKMPPRAWTARAVFVKAAGTSFAVLMMGQALPLHAQGFGYISVDAPLPGFAISPTGGSRVLVAWIHDGIPDDSIFLTEYRNGFHDDIPPQEIFVASRKIWSLKLEANAEDNRFLSLTDGAGSTFTTRLLRYDADGREVAQSQWISNSAYPSVGRMLGPQGRLFLSSHGNSATGRFVDGQTLQPDPWFTIQSQVIPTSDGSASVSGTTTVAGLDSAIESDGSVTAAYHLGRVRLKRYGADKQLQKSLLLDRPPYSYFTRVGRTAVAVNGSRTTLLAWEWHEYTLFENQLVRFPSIPAFRAIMPDGTQTKTIRLEPASTSSDHKDQPAVGILPDGTGAVAWTVRATETSTVWLQRLDSNLSAYEPPRRVDTRPEFNSDQPMIRSDGEGKLFLGWRCTAVDGEEVQIGILDLAELDRAPALPQVTSVAGLVRIDWTTRPASRTSLWFSPDLNPGNAHEVHSDEGVQELSSFEHRPDASSGFYWLRSN